MSGEGDNEGSKTSAAKGWLQKPWVQNLLAAAAVSLILGPLGGLVAFFSLTAGRGGDKSKAEKAAVGAVTAGPVAACAAIGTAIFPGIGTIIGAVVGYFIGKNVAEKVIIPRLEEKFPGHFSQEQTKEPSLPKPSTGKPAPAPAPKKAAHPPHSPTRGRQTTTPLTPRQTTTHPGGPPEPPAR